MKNNAKKRKMYEAFIETLPLLTSLEVNNNNNLVMVHKNVINQMLLCSQVSERMKVVDVLTTRVYGDSQQIIAQVKTLNC